MKQHLNMLFSVWPRSWQSLRVKDSTKGQEEGRSKETKRESREHGHIQPKRMSKDNADLHGLVL